MSSATLVCLASDTMHGGTAFWEPVEGYVCFQYDAKATGFPTSLDD